MNEPPPQFLAPGIEVLLVGHDGKPHRARVTEVLHAGGARLESIDGKASSVSEYSEGKEINTFHFPPADKASPAAGKKNAEAQT